MRRLPAVLTAAMLLVSLLPVAASALEPLDAETLQDTLTALIATHPTAKRTNVALKVTDLETGEVLFDQNSDKLFTPASNLKIYTSAAALDLLEPDWRPELSVELTGRTPREGVFRGQIELKPFNDGMFDTQALKALLGKAVDRVGMTRFEGDLLMGGFDWPNSLGPGWMWDDAGDYYSAPISKAMLNFNTVEVRVTKAEGEDTDTEIALVPPSAYPKIRREMPKGLVGYIFEPSRFEEMTEEEIKQLFTVNIYRDPKRPQITVSGLLDEPGVVKTTVTVQYPPEYILQVAKQILIDEFKIDYISDHAAMDEARGVDPDDPNREIVEENRLPTIRVTQPGASIAEAVKHFLKVSENAVGEMLLLTLSEKFGEGDKVSWPPGAKVISDWLVDVAGLERDSFRLVDGSGLSRYNLISADSSIRLLDYMKNESEHFEPFFDGLPIYKVDLPKDGGAKWDDVPLAEFDDQRIFAKPGGMSGVSTISGYVQTLDGRWLAFSLLGNGYIGSSAPVRDLRNQVWSELVRYQPAEVAVPSE